MCYTIAVSGINAIDNPGPGTGIARSLKESDLKVKIIGLAYDVMEPGIYMDWCIDKSYILPYPSGDVSSFWNRLLYIHEKEKIDVIISALDAELPLYMKLEPEFKKIGIGVMLPSKDAFNRRGKDKLHEIAKPIGLQIPETVILTNFNELDGALKKLGLPCMIKGPFYEAYKVGDRSEAEHYFHSLAAKWGYPIIVQKLIYGDEYNLVGLGDGTGKEIGHVATKKMMITKLGKVWTNVSIRNNSIDDAARKFVALLKWNGGFELELILDTKTNTFNLIEINPRFPAWVYVASGCGINLPERMVKKIMGLQYDTHSEYPAGKLLVRYTGELIRDISDLEKLTTLGEN